MVLAALGLGALVLGLLLAALKGGMRQVGGALLGCGLVGVTWNAVKVGPFEPADLFLVGAAASLFFHALARRRAPWMPALMLAGAGLLVVSGLLTAVDPPSAAYVAQRTVFLNPNLANPYVVYGLHTLSTGNLVELAKFLVALVLLPVAVQLLQPSPAAVRRLAAAWALSALLSAAVAIGDASGMTHISSTLLGYTPGDGRQAGLSVQPNHLAMALVIVTPVVLSWLRGARWAVRGLALPALVVLFAGVLLSGSRGGLLGVLLAAALTIIVVPELRPSPRVLALALPAFCLILIVVSVTLIGDVGTVSRLTGSSGDLSDAQRALAQTQAIADFTESPFHGIGFDHIADAHQELLQLLAAGGVVGLLGYVVYWLVALRAGLGARRAEPNLASVLLVSALCFLVVSLLENQVTDRYLYVPAALMVGLAAMRRPAANAAPTTARRAGGARDAWVSGRLAASGTAR